MRLPADYSEVVGEGVGVLRRIGAELRAEAERRPEARELWLSVRDLEGLAERLNLMTEWEWQGGFASLWTNGQDIGVLDELLTLGKHPDEHIAHRMSGDEVSRVTRLRRFLQQCCDGEFSLDGPAA